MNRDEDIRRAVEDTGLSEAAAAAAIDAGVAAWEAEEGIEPTPSQEHPAGRGGLTLKQRERARQIGRRVQLNDQQREELRRFFQPPVTVPRTSAVNRRARHIKQALDDAVHAQRRQRVNQPIATRLAQYTRGDNK